jgi:hypothetical protein
VQSSRMKPEPMRSGSSCARRQRTSVRKLLLDSSESYPGKPLFWDCRILYPAMLPRFFAVWSKSPFKDGNSRRSNSTRPARLCRTQDL